MIYWGSLKSWGLRLLRTKLFLLSPAVHPCNVRGNDMLGDIKVLEVEKPVVCFVLNLNFVENGIYHCAQLVLQQTVQD